MNPVKTYYVQKSKEDNKKKFQLKKEVKNNFFSSCPSFVFVLYTRMWLVCELGAGSGEQRAGKENAGSRDCRKKYGKKRFFTKKKLFYKIIFKNLN